MSDVAIAITQLVTFLTVVAGFVAQWFREKRNREWEIEDRKELAKNVARQASYVANTTLAQSEGLHKAIKENTEISVQAFKEANSVNEKIASLGLELKQASPPRREPEPSVDA